MLINKAKENQLQILIFPLLLVMYEVIIYLSNDAYLPALPSIASDLNTSQHTIQLTLTAWFFGSASMQMVFGPVSDRVGRRPVLLVGGIVFILVTIGCALSQSIVPLLFFRFIQGATITSMVVAGYATIHESFERESAIRVLAMMNSVIILAPAFGPLLGAVILHFASWRWIFGMLAIAAIIVISALFFKMLETASKNSNFPELKEIIKHYHNIFTNRRFMTLTLISQCLFATMIIWITAGPFLMITKFDVSPTLFGYAQVFIFGCFILGNRIVNKLIHHYSYNAIISFGLIAAFVGGSYALISAIFWQDILWNIIIAMMLLALGTGMALPVLNRIAIEAISESMGYRVATWSFLVNISGMLASAIISRFYNGSLFSVAIILFLFAVLAVFMYRAPRKEK